MRDLRLLIWLQDMNLTKSSRKPEKTTFFRGCAGLAATGVAARPALFLRFSLDFIKIRLETMNATAVAARPALLGVLQRRFSSILTLQ
jgi:hypothetical protein